MKKAFFGGGDFAAMERLNRKENSVFNVLQPVKEGKFSLSGEMGRAVDFIKREQLKDRKLWAKFVQQFRIYDDSKDGGWRGEYWGKMMRGACVTYLYDKDEELYEILQETVRDLLSTQDELGRISSYSLESEFFGWDVWGRKYVIIGLEYFYDICKEEDFKAEILKSICAQTDYMLEKIGDGDGKMAITDTSKAWGAVNSCSILEAIVWLYKETGSAAYLAFIEYLISTGGCKDGNLIETALENEKKPHEYPSRKAYEVTSYFNGVLETYRITGNPEYLKAVENFVKSVKQHDTTIIGCCGCDEETFDNSSVTQTEFRNIMQETCVTVTWMQICYELLCVTGDVSYAHWIEQSAYNAMLASVNYPRNKDVFFLPNEDQVEKIPLPFDSYNPLVNNRRGIVPGGYRVLYDGTYYGCCACIGSLGLGILPFTSIMKTENGFAFHLYENGVVETDFQGRKLRFCVQTAYPQGDSVKIKVKTDGSPLEMQLKLRIPDWSEQTELFVNGEACGDYENGYLCIERDFNTGDEITLTYQSTVKVLQLNGKIAVQKGVIVMARDERFLEDIEESVNLKIQDGAPVCESVKNTEFETRETLALTLKDGTVIHVCDYASAGADWTKGKNKITVWMPVKGV